MTDLKPKKIKVNGKPVTVFKAAFVQGLQRSVRISEASQDTPKFYEAMNLSEEVVRYVHQLLYPSLISCSTGSLPTEAEFLKLSDEEVNAWLNAAQERNEDWFSFNGAQSAEAEKKQS